MTGALPAAVPGRPIATWDRPAWTVAELVAAKGGRTVAVVLPALNEADTVAGVIESIMPLVGGLVDDLVVLDSGSTDDTAGVAQAAGARVVSREQALPQVPPVDGKGEVLWRSIAATTADIIVFIDADLVSPDPMFVPKLVGPILTCAGVELVKGYYRRPWRTAAQHLEDGGGRVTELVARPSSRRCGQSCRTSSNRWAASTPGPGHCCRRSRSHPGTASKSGYSSTPTRRAARRPSGRSTWGCGCTGTDHSPSWG